MKMEIKKHCTAAFVKSLYWVITSLQVEYKVNKLPSIEVRIKEENPRRISHHLIVILIILPLGRHGNFF